MGQEVQGQEQEGQEHVGAQLANPVPTAQKNAGDDVVPVGKWDIPQIVAGKILGMGDHKDPEEQPK